MDFEAGAEFIGYMAGTSPYHPHTGHEGDRTHAAVSSYKLQPPKPPEMKQEKPPSQEKQEVESSQEKMDKLSLVIQSDKSPQKTQENKKTKIMYIGDKPPKQKCDVQKVGDSQVVKQEGEPNKILHVVVGPPMFTLCISMIIWKN